MEREGLLVGWHGAWRGAKDFGAKVPQRCSAGVGRVELPEQVGETRAVFESWGVH